MLGGILFTAIVGTWAWFGSLEEVSIAQGQLAPLGEVYQVQPATAGEVIRLAVKEGDHVDQGQTIAELDQRLIEKEIERLSYSLNAYRQKLAQTKALIQQTRLGLSTLQTISRADIAARQSSIAEEAAAIATNERMLSQLQVDREAQLARMDRLAKLVERGAFAEDHLFQVEQELRDRDRSIIQAQGMAEQSSATIAQLQAELDQTKAMAQKNELDATKQLQQLQIEATQLEASIQETQALLERSQTELAQATLVAPVSGTISALEIDNVGVVLQPGQTIAEIAPSTAPLVLSALLPSEKAGLVKTGMPVNVKLDAFPYQDYGIVTGAVHAISPDTKAHEQMGAVYRVEITLDATDITHEGESVAFKAGQTATAEIIVRKRRIISLILEPIRKLKRDSLSL
ncbi:MAG: HlyD family type I secretion periplasmic adaptor subunit [Leptolyngbyaceae cyanobacterium SM2_5_2]|nr:HlyD family type I secretion periplasmic adaptor subunit [Leptolyngbyaceae cyanobacterium SM2_5_2]